MIGLNTEVLCDLPECYSYLAHIEKGDMAEMSKRSIDTSDDCLRMDKSVSY